jgi:hypothetical protein
MSEKTQAGPPLIGQFEGPKNNGPRENLQRNHDVDAVAEAARDLEASKSEKKLTTKEKKAKNYSEGLEAAELTLAEARTIVDAMMEKGAYEEDFRIAGRLTITLRSRDYGDVQRTMRFLEAENPTFVQNINDFVSRYNLAASLKRYNTDTFEFPQRRPDNTEAVENAFDKRLNYLAKIPTPVLDRMMQSLVAFDIKVAAALAEGAPEDF